VDRRDPRAVERARQVAAAELDEAGADPGPELASRTLRVGDDEQRVDVDAALADRLREALDEHGGLSRAGPGRDEDLASCRDGGRLLGVRRLHGRLTRQIVQRSHHDGHSPPRGS
jgi:hypothetical protein